MLLKIVCGERQQEYEFKKPTLLSELLTVCGVSFHMPCGGRKQCLACQVKVQGSILPPDAYERECLGENAINEHYRYACMTTLTGDAEVELPKSTPMAIQLDGILPKIQFHPLGKHFGIAFDIGTTTLAAYLWDLNDGKLLQTSCAPNPQSIYGADVVSRMEKSLAGKTHALSELVREELRKLSLQMVGSMGKSLWDLDAVVICGNTVMEYLLSERNPKSLSHSPFAADWLFGETFVKNSEESEGSGMTVHLMRCISAFVGADITAGILACGITERKDAVPVILLDIGTNGEMVLWTGEELLCCAVSAGPALEAAGISCGSSAQTGAISKVELCEADGELYLNTKTIGDAEATGICGSGLIDAVAVFVQTGLLDNTGRIVPEADEMGYITADEKLRVGDTEVLLMQEDIRALQLAKSAICSGLEVLLERAGLSAKDVEKVYLAGGFGTKLNVKSAELIGLLPKGFAKKTVAVGNAAGMGASAVLLNQSLIQKAEKIAENAKTLNLAEDALFQKKFIENMGF